MHVTTYSTGESRMKRNVHSSGMRESGRRDLEISAETVKVMRTVGEHEAFYFFEAMGKPTGDVARNLSDFLDKVETIKSESLVFHLQRGDFGNWVAKTLGDTTLAEKLGKIAPSNGAKLRTNVCTAVRNRIRELGEPTLAASIQDSEAVIPVRA